MLSARVGWGTSQVAAFEARIPANMKKFESKQARQLNLIEIIDVALLNKCRQRNKIREQSVWFL
jgi:hypothetical protein